MQLQAVIIPPDEVLEDAFAAARTISVAAAAGTEGPWPGALSGLLAPIRRRASSRQPEPVALTVVPSQASFVRLGSFGNVTANDAHKLSLSLTLAASRWHGPELEVIGLRFDRHEHLTNRLVVTALLGGDTDALFTLFSNVVEVGNQQDFFLDRRSYRTEFELASIDLPDDETAWERLDFGDAESHRGPSWATTELSLVRTAIKGGHRTYTVSEVLPLAEQPAPSS